MKVFIATFYWTLLSRVVFASITLFAPIVAFLSDITILLIIVFSYNY